MECDISSIEREAETLSPPQLLGFGEDTSHRIYAWAPRSEVVYLQAVFDAYEGVGRIRTERHDESRDRSLLLILCTPSNYSTALDLLRHLSTELSSPIEIV